MKSKEEELIELAEGFEQALNDEEFKLAKKLAEQKLTVSEQIYGQNDVTVAYALYDYAEVIEKVEDPGYIKKQMELLERGLQIIRSDESALEVYEYSGFLNFLGNVYRVCGLFEHSEECLQKAYHLERIYDQGVRSENVSIVESLSILYSSWGKYDLAKYYRKLTADVNRETPDNALVALFNESKILRANRDLAGAESRLLMALELSKNQQITNQKNLVLTKLELGKVRMDLGRIAEAGEVFLECEGLSKSWLNQTRVACLSYLAEYFEEVKNFKNGQQTYHDCLRILELLFGKEHRQYLTTQANYSLFLNNMGHSEEAMALQQQLLKVLRAEDQHHYLGSFYNTLGRTSAHLNMYKESEQYYKKALEIKSAFLPETHHDFGDIWYNMARLYVQQERWSLASAYFGRSNRNLLERICSQLPVMSEYEQRKCIDKLNSQIHVYYDFVKRQTDNKEDEIPRMLSVRISTRSITLQRQRFLRSRCFRSKEASVVANFQEWLQVKAKLAQYYNLQPDELLTDKQEIKKMEDRANKNERKQNPIKSGVWDPRIDPKVYDSLKCLLQPAEGIVEMVRFVTSENTITYLAITIRPDRDKPEIAWTEHGHLLENQAKEEYFAQLYNPSISARYDTYACYWAWLAPFLEGLTRIYFSGDGVYDTIQLGALRNPASNVLLEDQLTITKIASPTALLHNGLHQETQEKTFALFGTGEESSKDSATLPFAHSELQEVKHKLISIGWKQLAAMAEHGVLASARLIHIATHGYFEEPELSDSSNEIKESSLSDYHQLMLHSGLELNGRRITAFEVANATLVNTDLVYLAACKSGQGIQENSEGVYGLQRGFALAGCRAILSTYWEVGDKTAYEFSQFFYGRWLASGKTRESFEFAKARIKLKYKDYPIHWGAFELTEQQIVR